MLYPLLMCMCNYGSLRRWTGWGGVLVSVLRSLRWLMVYRRTLMGDSSLQAAAGSVTTWVTCNLSPGSEANTPQHCRMRQIHSLCFPSWSTRPLLTELGSCTLSWQAWLSVYWKHKPGCFLNLLFCVPHFNHFHPPYSPFRSRLFGIFQGMLNCPLTCPGISLSLTLKIISGAYVYLPPFFPSQHLSPSQ